MQTITERSRYILGLLRIAKELGVPVTATRLQKVTFLVEKELNYHLGYTFIPYYFGPFSKDLQDDVYALKRRGLVEIFEEPVVDSITGAVVGFKKTYTIKELTPMIELEEKLAKFLAEKLIIPLGELLRYIYLNYPQYTANSLIKDKIF